MSLQVAYISQGKLYLWSAEEPLREIESEFGRGVQERTQRSQTKNAWKNRSLMSMMMPPGMVKQMAAQAQEALVNISINSICSAEPGNVLYALESDSVSGIFRFNPTRDREDRLFHNADFKVSHLDLNSEHGLIACTTTHPNGTANVATMPLAGARPREITEGDSIDIAPRWVTGTRALVFQSAGVARSGDGYVYDRAAFCIEKLDLDRQEVTTLAEDPKSDLLGPQMDRQGTLYYIRRPYRRSHPSLLDTLKNFLLIPVRLAQALYGWIDFFTQRYTGNPLFTAGAERQELEPKVLKAWGDSIRPEMLKKGNRRVDQDAPALVPETWQLIRQGQHGSPEVLANGVLHYDLAEDGTLIYTNGSAIFKRSPNGEVDRLYVGKWIEFLALL